MNRIWFAVVAGVVLMVPGGVLGQEAGAPVRLSLEDAIAGGLAAAPRLAESRARTAAAAASVQSRETLSLPVVTASAAYVRTNHIEEFSVAQAGGVTRIIFPDIPNTYRARLEVAVPLFPSERVRALVTSARAEERATEADRDMTAGDLRLDITRAYWALVTARQNARVVAEALARLDASVGDVKSRVDAGFLPPNELLSAQAQRARESVLLIQARNTEALAQADLARLAGLDAMASIEPTTTLDVSAPGAAALASRPLAALVQEARDNRPERHALTERAAAADATGQAAIAQGKPEVGVIAGVQPARPNNVFVPRTDTWQTSWDVGLYSTWQLWDHGRAQADRRTADAQAEALRDRLHEFDAVLAVEIRQRLLDIQAGAAAIDASGQAVSAAAEAERVVGERLRAGVATSTDVLDAHVALLQAELERTQLTAALRVSEARLVRAVGGR